MKKWIDRLSEEYRKKNRLLPEVSVLVSSSGSAAANKIKEHVSGREIRIDERDQLLFDMKINR